MPAQVTLDDKYELAAGRIYLNGTQALVRLLLAQKILARHDVHFWPGINEDLAATAVWGTQMTNLAAAAKFDGVFAMWYGKGAGLDRCGDVMRHAHGAGTASHGGVLAVVGDDHAQKSST